MNNLENTLIHVLSWLTDLKGDNSALISLPVEKISTVLNIELLIITHIQQPPLLCHRYVHKLGSN